MSSASELLKQGRRTPSPSETSEWTTSASPPEINQATGSGTSDDAVAFMAPVTSTVSTSTHTADGNASDSQGWYNSQSTV